MAVLRIKEMSDRKLEIYISDLFNKVRTYVEKKYNKWFILSAKYFLVETFIEPYNETLNGKIVEERQKWSMIVSIKYD